jgi:peptidyl-prolyl cis-trans isomerase C
MKRNALVALCLLVAVTALAQQSAAPADDSQKIVATVNGERIPRAQLDLGYASMPPQMREQYEQAGGKMTFLDNYIEKRLLLQEAVKSGFDQKPAVRLALERARESALYDRYIRDVVASSLVNEAGIRKYYDEHLSDFPSPEKVKVRHIIAMPQPGQSKEPARLKIQSVLMELRAGVSGAMAQTPAAERIFLSRFGEAARKYSEDASATSGGDLGWQIRGSLDPQFEEAAFNIKPGVLSGIIETQYGYHLILVEEKKPAGTLPYEEVRGDIREVLLAQKSADILLALKRLGSELKANSKVALFPENVQ